MDASRNSSALAVLAFVFGIVSLAFSIMLITAPLGLLLGLAGAVLGLINRRRGGRSGGLALSLLSLLVIAFWISSVWIPFWADATLRFQIVSFLS